MAEHTDEITYKVNRMHTDLYFGRGKNDPPITTRLMVVEESYDRMSRNINKAIWLAVSTLGIVLVNLIKTLLAK